MCSTEPENITIIIVCCCWYFNISTSSISNRTEQTQNSLLDGGQHSGKDERLNRRIVRFLSENAWINVALLCFLQCVAIYKRKH